MGYADRYASELEDKRRSAAVAVGAYLAILRDGKRLLDPKTDLGKKVDILLPPIVKFEEIIKIAKA